MTTPESCEFDNLVRENREAWNEAARKHQAAKKTYWDEFFDSPDAIIQKGVELEMLLKIGVRGRRIAHLCCNNGVELLSLKNMGADQCVGFDLSDLAIQEAQERSLKSGIGVEFLQTSVYDIPESYYGRFDCVYVTAGALGWLPDLERFFAKADRLLADHGKIFIYEIHPLTDVLNDDRNPDIHPLQAANPYFRGTPYTSHDSLDYVGHTRSKGPRRHWFTHTISALLMGMIRNGFQISVFEEYEHDISGVYPLLVEQNAKIPLSYLLIGTKSGPQ